MKSKIIAFLIAGSIFAIISILFIVIGIYLMIVDGSNTYRFFILASGIVSSYIWIHCIDNGFESLKWIKNRSLENIKPVDLYPLFEHMKDQHDLTLLDSELFDIIEVVQKMQKKES